MSFVDNVKYISIKYWNNERALRLLTYMQMKHIPLSPATKPRYVFLLMNSYQKTISILMHFITKIIQNTNLISRGFYYENCFPVNFPQRCEYWCKFKLFIFNYEYSFLHTFILFHIKKQVCTLEICGSKSLKYNFNYSKCKLHKFPIRIYGFSGL